MDTWMNTAAIGWVRRHSSRSRRDDVVAGALRLAAARVADMEETEEDREVLARCGVALEALARQRHELTRLHAQGLDVIGQLSNLAGGTHVLADDARRHLRELTLHAHRLAELPSGAPPVDLTEPIDDDVDFEIALGAQRARDRLVYLWSVVGGFACALGVVGLLHTGHAGLATMLFVARVLLDVALATYTGAATDLVPAAALNHSLSLRTRFFGGVVSRLGEVAMWMGIALVPATEGASGLSLAYAGVVVVTLFASLVRVGAGEAGIPVVRTAREQVCGTAGIAAGLVLITLGAPALGALVTIGSAAVCSAAETALVLRRVWRLQTTDVGLILRCAGDEGTLRTSFVQGPAPRRRH